MGSQKDGCVRRVLEDKFCCGGGLLAGRGGAKGEHLGEKVDKERASPQRLPAVAHKATLHQEGAALDGALCGVMADESQDGATQCVPASRDVCGLSPSAGAVCRRTLLLEGDERILPEPRVDVPGDGIDEALAEEEQLGQVVLALPSWVALEDEQLAQRPALNEARDRI